ncbi:MAG: PAS domain S-box protein [Deltaproteobacteria bacterium]|nr:PAS domain S-box protein [Deltaproteobacteria bacterium]
MTEEPKKAPFVLGEDPAAELNRLRHLIMHAPYGLYLIDRTSTVVIANRRGAERLGTTVDKLVGSQMADHMPEATAAARRARGLEVFLTGEATTFEDRVGDRWFLSTLWPIKDEQGEVTHLGIYGVDITEQKRVQESLRESQALYRLVTENVADVVWVLDPRTLRFKYVSPSVERLLGYTAEELAELTVDQLVTEETRAVLRAQVAERRTAFEAGEPGAVIRLNDIEQVRKDGSRVWVEMSTTYVRNAAGELEVIGSSRDVTARRRLEERLRQAHKMEAVGTLAGGIAHDFNNILMAIQGNASLVRADLAEDDPFRERLEAIEECVRSASELTRQLLGFARGGAYSVVPTDLNDLVERTARLFGRSRKQISLHHKPAADLWTVEVDRSQIEQVLLNLMVNAWHAMPEGGDLYLETGNLTLDEDDAKSRGVRPGRYVRVAVTDTGVGMDEATRSRVFEPFFTTKGMGRGTGLGLATVYGMVTSHGGFLTVYSEPARGSTFNVHLPASDRPVVETAGPPAGPVVTGTETILLVDDEVAVRSTAAAMLARLGYTVLAAASGEEALDCFARERNRIDLVVLDMVMPGLGGRETFHRLRALDPGLRVLLASGYSLNGEARELLDRGCRAFLQKPWSLAELSLKLRRVLDG